MSQPRAQIGVSPILWYNDDDPRLGTDLPLAECLSQVAGAGYAGIELGHLFPHDAGELRELLQHYGLKLVSGWYSATLLERGVAAELEAMQAHVALLEAAGCDLIVWGDVSGAVHRDPCPLRARPQLTNPRWGRFAQDLDNIAKRLADRGIRLALHHHMGTVIQTADEVQRLIESTSDAVGLTYDTGHLAYASGHGHGLVEFVDRFAQRIVHVHLKDVRRGVLEAALTIDQPFLDAVADGVFTVPGDGALRFTPMLERLAAHRYDGWLVVEAEQDPDKADPQAFATVGYRNVRDYAELAGFVL